MCKKDVFLLVVTLLLLALAKEVCSLEENSSINFYNNESNNININNNHFLIGEPVLININVNYSRLDIIFENFTLSFEDERNISFLPIKTGLYITKLYINDSLKNSINFTVEFNSSILIDKKNYI